jgi:hypothetical protein
MYRQVKKRKLLSSPFDMSGYARLLLYRVSLAHTCSHFVAETNTALRHVFNVLVVHGFVRTCSFSALWSLLVQTRLLCLDAPRHVLICSSTALMPHTGHCCTSPCHRPDVVTRLDMTRYDQICSSTAWTYEYRDRSSTSQHAQTCSTFVAWSRCAIPSRVQISSPSA